MGAWQIVVPTGHQHVYDDWHIAPAVRAGGMLLCSGVLGEGGDGSVSADPVEQYHQVFRNLEVLLGEAGLGFGDVVDLLSFHLDLANQIAAFTQVKDEYLHEPYPAWTAVEVAGLGGGAFPGALVEMKATAVL